MQIHEYGVTVQTVLDMMPDGSCLSAGGTGADRLILSARFYHAHEDEGMPSCGEMLFYGCAGRPDPARALMDVLAQMADAGAGCLAVYPADIPVPREAVFFADSLSLPIVQVRDENAAAGLITRVLGTILNNQTHILNNIQDISHSLTSIMLQGGNLQEICDLLYSRFGNSVAISSDYLSSYVLNTTEDRKEAIGAILEAEKKNAFLGKQAPQPGVARADDQIKGKRYTRIVFPILNDNLLYGRIYMWEDCHTISSVEESVLAANTSLIALDLMKKMSLLQMENSNRAGFLEDLLSADRRQFQKSLSSAKNFDFDVRAGHRVMVLRMRSYDKRSVDTKSVAYQISTTVISMFQPVVRNTSIKIIYSNQGHQIVLLLETAPSTGAKLTETMDVFTQALYDTFHQNGLGHLMAAGIGREYHSPVDLYKSYSEAKRALVCPQPDSAWAVYYEDTGVYRLLTYGSIRNEAELFREEFLQALEAYDESKDTRLVDTLSAYFKHGGNLTKMSREMNIHYNTAMNRLQRIQELIGGSLEDPDLSLCLALAIKLRGIVENA